MEQGENLDGLLLSVIQDDPALFPHGLQACSAMACHGEAQQLANAYIHVRAQGARRNELAIRYTFLIFAEYNEASFVSHDLHQQTGPKPMT